MEISQVISEYGQQFDIPELGFDEDSSCCVVVDDDLTLQMLHFEDSHQIRFECPLGFIPADDDTEPVSIRRRMLAAQMLGEKTNGCRFSIDPDGDEVVFSKTVPVDDIGHVEAFVKHFDDVAGGALFWKSEFGLSFAS